MYHNFLDLYHNCLIYIAKIKWEEKRPKKVPLEKYGLRRPRLSVQSDLVNDDDTDLKLNDMDQDDEEEKADPNIHNKNLKDKPKITVLDKFERDVQRLRDKLYKTLKYEVHPSSPLCKVLNAMSMIIKTHFWVRFVHGASLDDWCRFYLNKYCHQIGFKYLENMTLADFNLDESDNSEWKKEFVEKFNGFDPIQKMDEAKKYVKYK